MSTPSRPCTPHIASLVNPRAVESSAEEDLMWEVVDNADQSPGCVDLRKSNSLAWLEVVEEAGYNVAHLPPAYIILYPGALIKDRAWQLIQSKDESPAATAGLVCIAKEAELMFKLFRCQFEVRWSASNLMLNKDSEFATAAAGAMLGMAEEAMPFGLSLDDHDMYMENLMCDEIRHQTTKLFPKLEKGFACKAADNADADSTPVGGTSEKPIGEEVKEEVGGLDKELKEKRKLKKIGNETKLDSCKDLAGKHLLTSEQLE